MANTINKPIINTIGTDPIVETTPSKEGVILFEGVSPDAQAKHNELLENPPNDELVKLLGRNSKAWYSVTRFRKHFPDCPIDIKCLKSMNEEESSRATAIGSIKFMGGPVTRDVVINVSVWDVYDFTRQVVINKDDTIGVIADKIVNLFLDSKVLPFTTTKTLERDSATVVFTAEDKSMYWNGLMISLDKEIPDVDYEMVTTTGGKGTYNVADTLKSSDGENTITKPYMAYIFSEAIPVKMMGDYLDSIWNSENTSISSIGYTYKSGTASEIEAWAKNLNYKEIITFAHITSQGMRATERGVINMIPSNYVSSVVAQLMLMITPGSNTAKLEPKALNPVGGLYNVNKPMHGLVSDYPGAYNGRSLDKITALNLNREGISYLGERNGKSITTDIKTFYKKDSDGLPSSVYSFWNRVMAYVIIQRLTYIYFVAKYGNVAYTDGAIPIGADWYINTDNIDRDSSGLFNLLVNNGVVIGGPEHKKYFMEGIRKSIDYNEGRISLSNLRYIIATQIRYLDIYYNARVGKIN